jgi:D-alanine-D-alanine ligase
MLLLGGFTEREVSLLSGKEVKDALIRLGHEVDEFDIKKQDLCSAPLEKFDIIFNSLHGGVGENGIVQSICEIKNIPYTGSNVLASALAMNKVLAKKVFSMDGINTPEGIVSNTKNILTNEPFSRPYVIKPIDGGSSLGVNIIFKETKLNKIKSSSFYVMVEKYIKGREIAVAVIGNKVIGMIEIDYPDRFYDYNAKYKSNKNNYIIPSNLNMVLKKKIERYALSAHKAIGCKGITRSDFIISEEADDKVFLLEINTLPGLTRHSLVPKIANNAGITFDKLISMILKDALR